MLLTRMLCWKPLVFLTGKGDVMTSDFNARCRNSSSGPGQPPGAVGAFARCDQCQRPITSVQWTSFPCKHRICGGCIISNGSTFSCPLCAVTRQVLSPTSSSATVPLVNQELPFAAVARRLQFPTSADPSGRSFSPRTFSGRQFRPATSSSNASLRFFAPPREPMLPPGSSMDLRSSSYTTTSVVSQVSSFNQLSDALPPSSPGRLSLAGCGRCRSGTYAPFWCDNCKIMLCYDCVDSHRVSLCTAMHRIVDLHSGSVDSAPINPTSCVPTYNAVAPTGRLSQTDQEQQNAVVVAMGQLAICNGILGAPSTAAAPAGSALSFCSLHLNDCAHIFCERCLILICPRCAPDHRGHGLRLSGGRPIGSTDVVGIEAVSLPTSRLVSCGRAHLRLTVGCIDAVHCMCDQVEKRVTTVIREIHNVSQSLIAALEERRNKWLEQIESIRSLKMTILTAQEDRLRQYRDRIKMALTNVEAYLKAAADAPATGGGADSAQLRHWLKELENCIKCFPFDFFPQEDDGILFVSPKSAILSTIMQSGCLRTNANATNSFVVSESGRHHVKDSHITYVLHAMDHFGQPLTMGGDVVSGLVLCPNGALDCMHVLDRNDGTYTCTFVPKMEGDHQINFFVRGRAIGDGPLTLTIKGGRCYRSIDGQYMSFCSQGSNDGQLYRPWGITCDRLNRIIVADRTNHRIQIFDCDGNFLTKFGSPGCRNGQFDRPTGVAVTSSNNIVVVDKDNHRVQVFTQDGSFLFKFGEKGREISQFNYPWDVAVSSEDIIAVSDTRNHRVQLFTSTGLFWRKFGFETSALYKQFDSPRGLSFGPDGRLYCTDFNNHRLVIYDVAQNRADIVGIEGEGKLCFRRPQGIDVDIQGNIFIADSRNNRIQVLTSQFTYVTSIGLGRTSQGRPLMDTPTDVCVTADGKIFVVDFGNNRVMVF
uniref:RING-type domain-containing protein n=1 Tax=Trichuris muris TaxID=70415 RepID=A0A5S6QFJ6_TRIMR